MLAKIPLQPVRGTRDMYPDEMRFRTYLFNAFRSTARAFGFEEYEVPVLENSVLWQRKAGEEIVKQLFHFTYQDDGVTKHVCMRPEMTPSLARLVLKKRKTLLMPLKWFTIAQCWRLESVQTGRKREHFQWNADILGVKSVTAEAELISAMISFLTRVGLTSDHVRVRISDRRLLTAAAEAVCVPDDLVDLVCIEIDKIDKVGSEAVNAALRAAPFNLGVDAVSILLAVTSSKSPADASEIITRASSTLRLEQSDDRIRKLADGFKSSLEEISSLVAGYGYEGWLEFDPGVVRGLSYYTGTVFEVSDKIGKDGSARFRALAGGGRYDKLASTIYGGGTSEDIPAVGFGFGDCTIEELMRATALIPLSCKAVRVDALVIPFDHSMRPAAMAVLRRLRDSGLSADVVMDDKKEVKWSFSYADRRGAVTAVFVAPDEWMSVTGSSVRIKSLREKGSSDRGAEVKLDGVADFVKDIVSRVVETAPPL